MSAAAFVYAVLQALIALPKIGAMIEKVIDAVIAMRISNMNEANAHAIADAAAFNLRAKTKEERLEASKKWQQVFSRAAPK